MSGAAVMVGGTVVNASSATQHCVTLSTSEAEYVAMAQGAKTALFTKAVLDFLQPELANETIDLFEEKIQSAGGGRNRLTYVITLSGS